MDVQGIDRVLNHAGIKLDGAKQMTTSAPSIAPVPTALPILRAWPMTKTPTHAGGDRIQMAGSPGSIEVLAQRNEALRRTDGDRKGRAEVL